MLPVLGVLRTLRGQREEYLRADKKSARTAE